MLLSRRFIVISGIHSVRLSPYASKHRLNVGEYAAIQKKEFPTG
jgi:hypothetical protein